MKKSLLIVIIIVIVNDLSFAQNYFYFPDSNAIWSVNIDKYTVLGDTTIIGKNYKKYYKSANDSTMNYDSLKYFAAVREDTNKIIYGILKDNTTEQVLYNFSLTIGDTISIPIFTNSLGDEFITLKVCNIDSIVIGQEYRKRFHMFNYDFCSLNSCNNDCYFSEYWIGGIGSSSGLFNAGISCLPIMDAPSKALLCYEENNVLMYIDSFYNVCYHKEIGGSVDENNYKKTSTCIYPHPIYDITKIQLDYPNTGKLVLKIYDFFGKEIKEYITINNEFEIKRSYLYPGLFYYQIYDKQKIIDIGKLIVE